MPAGVERNLLAYWSVWNYEEVDISDASTDAFEELYQRSHDRLARQLFALTGDWQGSFDLTQEAFVRTWERWDRVANYEDPEAYVRRVAFNLAKSNWRRLRRIVRVTPPDVAQEAPDNDSRYALVAALRSIPATQREAIVRHYLADEPIDQVAREMGVPLGTVKSWLSRGRSRLAECLGVKEAEGLTTK